MSPFTGAIATSAKGVLADPWISVLPCRTSPRPMAMGSFALSIGPPSVTMTLAVTPCSIGCSGVPIRNVPEGDATSVSTSKRVSVPVANVSVPSTLTVPVRSVSTVSMRMSSPDGTHTLAPAPGDAPPQVAASDQSPDITAV